MEQVAAEQTAKKIVVSVMYNGISKEMPIEMTATVRQLLDLAIKKFEVTVQPHLLALFTEAGAELPDSSTVQQAGIERHAHLLMRPSTVRGG